MKRKLRCVLLYSSGHLGSATVFNQLQRMDEFEIVGMVRADSVSLDQQGLQKAAKQFQKLGFRFSLLLLWQRLIQTLVYACTRVLPWTVPFQAGRHITVDAAIPEFQTDSINNQETQNWIAAQEPDLLISAYFTQILKRPVINIPRLGVLNIHPGWLPAYRGAMVYFWALHNQESHAGVSVHWIDEGIDTGSLLARRRIPLNKRSTQERVLFLTAMIGSRMLQRIGRQLLHGEAPQAIDTSNEAAAYYRMPRRQEFLRYWAMRRFFRIRDLAALLCCRFPV